MKVSVIRTEFEVEKLAENSLTYFVEQANNKAIFNQQSYCKLSDRVVKALVPACSSTVSSQESEISFKMLIACYESCINMAASDGANNILIQPLGTGIKKDQTSTIGTVRSDGLWGDLFWTSSKSSLAARQAVSKVVNIIPNDVCVFFIIQEDNIDDWSWALNFN